MGTGVVQVYSGTGVVEELRCKGVVLGYNGYRSSAGVQKYCRYIGIQDNY